MTVGPGWTQKLHHLSGSTQPVQTDGCLIPGYVLWYSIFLVELWGKYQKIFGKKRKKQFKTIASV